MTTHNLYDTIISAVVKLPTAYITSHTMHGKAIIFITLCRVVLFAIT